MKSLTCDICARPYDGSRKQHYCSHCQTFHAVCPSCKKNQAVCPRCGIRLTRKLEPVRN